MANKVDYFEIGSPDPEASRKFYGDMFGWQFGAANPGTQYAAINETEGGLWDTSLAMEGAHWGIFYVHVDDVPATIAKAKEMGAKVLVDYNPEADIDFAHLEDPQGNRFGIWKQKD